MTTRIAKTAALTAGAVAVVLVLLAYSTMFAPAAAQTSTTNASSATSTRSTGSYTNSAGFPPGGPPQGGIGPGGQDSGPQIAQGQAQNRVNVSVGQTIILASTQGVYHVVGDRSENGTASGSLTFTVTGSLSEGYTLALSSGSLTINGTTYTISSGTAQMNPSANAISGQGTTSPTGVFIVQASAHGNFVGSSGSVSLDFTAGTTEYLVNLTTSVQG